MGGSNAFSLLVRAILPPRLHLRAASPPPASVPEPAAAQRGAHSQPHLMQGQAVQGTASAGQGPPAPAQGTGPAAPAGQQRRRVCRRAGFSRQAESRRSALESRAERPGKAGDAARGRQEQAAPLRKGHAKTSNKRQAASGPTKGASSESPPFTTSSSTRGSGGALLEESKRSEREMPPTAAQGDDSAAATAWTSAVITPPPAPIAADAAVEGEDLRDRRAVVEAEAPGPARRGLGCNGGSRPESNSPSLASTNPSIAASGADGGKGPCTMKVSAQRRAPHVLGHRGTASMDVAAGLPQGLSLTSPMGSKAEHPATACTPAHPGVASRTSPLRSQAAQSLPASGRPRPRAQRRSVSTPKPTTSTEGPAQANAALAPATSARFSSPLPSESPCTLPQVSAKAGITRELPPYDRSQSFDASGCCGPPGAEQEAQRRGDGEGRAPPAPVGARQKSVEGGARTGTPLAALRMVEAEEGPLSSPGSTHALSPMAPRQHKAAKGVKVGASFLMPRHPPGGPCLVPALSSLKRRC